MKKIIAMFMACCLLFPAALAQETEFSILLGESEILVNGAEISLDSTEKVYLQRKIEVHEDVPDELAGLENRVITIADAGTYRIRGSASDAQIAVRAGAEDEVRIILDGVGISCRTAPAIAVYSASDERTAGEYGVTIELAEGSENSVSGSHTEEVVEGDVKLSGAITGLVSLGFEGSGSLNVDADNEGIEVKFGHMTFNGGSFRIEAGDDPINVSEDGFGVLTVNDGYLYSAVKPEQGGEGDGIDSNGWIVFNGGTIINLAHPTSGDSGIDSDMGSSINGGLVVGAGNMYDPIDENSAQLFMMLEFSEETDDLLAVTDANGEVVFAYDFPHSYKYIAFSAPELAEGEYSVYLGGEIGGEEIDGLYTRVDSYVPGKLLSHGAGNTAGAMETPPQDFGAQDEFDERMFDMEEQYNAGLQGERRGFMDGLERVDLNEILKDADLNELLADKDLNQLLWGFDVRDLLTQEQMDALAIDPDAVRAMPGEAAWGGFEGAQDGFRRMRGIDRRGMESSGDVASTRFMLSKDSTGFTNVTAAE